MKNRPLVYPHRYYLQFPTPGKPNSLYATPSRVMEAVAEETVWLCWGQLYVKMTGAAVGLSQLWRPEHIGNSQYLFYSLPCWSYMPSFWDK